MRDNVFRKRTWAGNEIVEARSGLLPDACWRPVTRSCPTELTCSIRRRLAEKIPGLCEKFNAGSRYFGYHLPRDKDRAYIYLRKNGLIIDVCISPKLTPQLQRLGFDVRRKTNFQGKAGWLTGWRVPHSSADVDTVVAWIFRAFPSV